MASVGIPDPVDETSDSLPPSSGCQKKSWEQLRQAVRKSRRLACLLLSRVPHSFTFQQIETFSGTKTRAYFLGVPAGSRENTLLYVDIDLDASITSLDELQWKLLLDSFTATPVHGQFSKEEQLLRERKRLGSFGITSYDYSEAAGRFVLPACGSLFHCTDFADGHSSPVVLPEEVKSSQSSPRLDPKLCPTNPDLLACVCNSDLWLSHIVTNQEIKLTNAHKGLKSLSEDSKSAGVPSFVVQEEFDRYTGFWWQPKHTGDRQLYRILYEEVDESEVQLLHIMSSASDGSGYDEYRYPRAGTENARSTLRLLEIRIDDVGVVSVVDKQLVESLQTMFPWMEYLLRAGWTPDGQYVYAQLLDRMQQKLQLVLLPLDAFIASFPTDEDFTSLPVPSPNVQVIYEETSNVWVNVHDILYFLPQENAGEVTFLWSNEKTGFRHLYLVTSALHPLAKDYMDSDDDMVEKPYGSLEASVLREVALTQGDWEVGNKQIWVDEHQKLVYFMATKDSPLQTHLYVVSYKNPASVVRLTKPGYSHTVYMDKECSLYVSVYSSINRPPASQVFRIDREREIFGQPLATLQLRIAVPEEYISPELFQFKNRAGFDIHGMLYRPKELEQGKKYPTVMFVYGGPQVQLVTDSYKGMRFLRLHTLASLGYAVVVLDTRGSCHRGLQFEGYIRHRLGVVEVEEQVEGLEWVADKVGFIDLNRVAIHGWSYGGYLALMGLVQRPDIFKVAVAGAPVTSWLLYDTGYTERYMGLPEDNESGYRMGSVLEYVEKFPSEENRLLIVHGLIDENVHFYHTSTLINALIKACKPYQLQIYPNERHGIRHPDASEHYETLLLSFLQNNL